MLRDAWQDCMTILRQSLQDNAGLFCQHNARPHQTASKIHGEHEHPDDILMASQEMLGIWCAQVQASAPVQDKISGKSSCLGISSPLVHYLVCMLSLWQAPCLARNVF